MLGTECLGELLNCPYVGHQASPIGATCREFFATAERVCGLLLDSPTSRYTAVQRGRSSEIAIDGSYGWT